LVTSSFIYPTSSHEISSTKIITQIQISRAAAPSSLLASAQVRGWQKVEVLPELVPVRQKPFIVCFLARQQYTDHILLQYTVAPFGTLLDLVDKYSRFRYGKLDL